MLTFHTMSHQQLGVNSVAVTPTLLVLDNIALHFQVSDYLLNRPFGDPCLLGNLSGRGSQVLGYVSKNPSVVGNECPFSFCNRLCSSTKIIDTGDSILYNTNMYSYVSVRIILYPNSSVNTEAKRRCDAVKVSRTCVEILRQVPPQRSSIALSGKTGR